MNILIRTAVDSCAAIVLTASRGAAIIATSAALLVGALASPGSESRADERQSASIQTWFDAWELVSTEVYGVNRLRPVEFVFFDSEFVYSTASSSVPAGRAFRGPGRLMNRRFDWKVGRHDGILRLPDGSEAPVRLMSFAAPLRRGRADAFFVMPLPEFWEAAEVSSEELGLDNLLTAVFLHEFAHSQQMRNFGAQLSLFETEYGLRDDLSDDIVQDRFEDDEAYEAAFRQEVEAFFHAAHADNTAERLATARSAIAQYRQRQERYFVGDQATSRDFDDFFLTMEGFGQYTMYAWLTHKDGAALDGRQAEAGIRRGGRWWSQEQGLALFLVLAQLSEPSEWADDMFGADYRLVIELLEEKLRDVPN